ncbi:MAG: SRPBCC family protein [bacterium]
MTAISRPSRSMSSLLLGAAGGVLVGARSRRRGPSTIAAIAGLALVGAAAHRPLADALRRAGASRRSAHIRLSFVVPRSVHDVFRFCSDFENFPRFVGALRDVEDFGDGRSHWSAWTPTGGTVAWDAITTKFVTNRVIAWRSAPGSPVDTCGTLRFVREADGGTCVKVSLDYVVVDGSMADAVAALAIPRRSIDVESDIKRLAESVDLFVGTAEHPVVEG